MQLESVENTGFGIRKVGFKSGLSCFTVVYTKQSTSSLSLGALF